MVPIENAPKKGTIYATFVDKMVYRKYVSLDEISEYLTEDGMLELHLFDREKELRFIKTAKNGLQQYEISSAEAYDDVYEECLCVADAAVDEGSGLPKVCVVNYIRYDENDMVRIVNYRLKEAEE